MTGGSHYVDLFAPIMKNKELLLDRNPQRSPVRFIFSHSALREGWDNPNVFQICTLKQSASEVRKRQEVGRGLRLCVNQDGERMDAGVLGADVHNVNVLTVVASESYESFAKGLQTEIAEAVADRPVKVTAALFEGKVIKDLQGNEQVIDNELASAIIFDLVKQDYVDKKYALTDKFYEDRKNGTVKVAEEVQDCKDDIINILDSVYNSKAMQPVLDYRVDKTKWCILRYPNASMAQLANTSREAFADFYYNVCTLDYAKMSRAMDPLVELLNKSDKVNIKGPGTDLQFSIKGIGAVKCAGEANIPDGEVYTAPVLKSMNGYITYNTASREQGFTYENIRFEIKDGRITKATANDTGRINQLLDTDEGARFFGEFAFGVNPYVLHPMKDTLFDEKIAGSFHLTPGMCYEDAPNGNKSSVHWDLVTIQRPEYGGGEIWLDDKLIRKDGLFVLPELEPLNPENLK